MKRILILSFLASLLLGLFSAGASAAEADEAYQKAKDCYQDVKTDIHKINEPKDWHKCISQFKEVAEKYPKSGKADAALYSAARLYRELYERTQNIEDINEAIHLYNAVVRDYPQSPLADDALFHIGSLRSDPLKDNERARRAYSTVLERYPKGDMAPQAKAALASLGPAETITETDLKEEAVKPEAAKKEKQARKESKKKSNDPFRITKLVSYNVDVKGDQTVITLMLDSDVPFTRKFVDYGPRTKSPPQLMLYFPRTKMDEGVEKDRSITSAHLESINIKEGLFSGELKIRFQLTKSTTYKIVQTDGKTVIYLYPEGKAPASVKTESDEPATDKKKVEEVKSRVASARKLRIVIDPGHGGKDRGAVGPHGVEEKNVTLAISKKLAAALEKKLGAKVFLTRTRDKNLSLEKRNAFANAKKADIFISIHANAVVNRKISGIETYYLNNATDEAATRLAARENRSASKSQSEVDQILLTLFQNYNTEESRLLADQVHKAVISNVKRKYPKTHNRGVRSALFYLLVGAKCPGILFEASYISNQAEEKRLITFAFQTQIANSIAEGVKKYVKNQKELAAYLQL